MLMILIDLKSSKLLRAPINYFENSSLDEIHTKLMMPNRLISGSIRRVIRDFGRKRKQEE